MKLVVGLPFQGKRAFACTLSGQLELTDSNGIADGASCSLKELETAQVIDRFDLVLCRLAEEQLSYQQEIEKMLKYNPNVILILQQSESSDSHWVRLIGEAGQYLAAKAQEVYQVVCGISFQIK